MAFPDDKETWRRVVGKNLALGILGDKVKTGDQNNIADFLERLEDLLGYSFIEGYATLKEKLDDLPTKETNFVLNQLIQGKL